MLMVIDRGRGGYRSPTFGNLVLENLYSTVVFDIAIFVLKGDVKLQLTNFIQQEKSVSNRIKKKRNKT